MQTKAKSDGLYLALSVAILSVVLLFLSASQLPSRFLLLYGNATREKLLDNKNPSDKDLDDLALSREQAIEWNDTGASLDDLAVVNFEKAVRKNLSTPEGGEYIKKTMLFQQRSLEKAPANSYGWALLSYLYYITEGISENAAKALERSIETNPYEPGLMLSRLEMSINLMSKLDDDTRASLPSIMRNTWKLYPYATAKSANKNHYTALLEEALSGDTEQLSKLDAILKRK